MVDKQDLEVVDYLTVREYGEVTEMTDFGERTTQSDEYVDYGIGLYKDSNLKLYVTDGVLPDINGELAEIDALDLDKNKLIEITNVDDLNQYVTGWGIAHDLEMPAEELMDNFENDFSLVDGKLLSNEVNPLTPSHETMLDYAEAGEYEISTDVPQDVAMYERIQEISSLNELTSMDIIKLNSMGGENAHIYDRLDEKINELSSEKPFGLSEMMIAEEIQRKGSFDKTRGADAYKEYMDPVKRPFDDSLDKTQANERIALGAKRLFSIMNMDNVNESSKFTLAKEFVDDKNTGIYGSSKVDHKFSLDAMNELNKLDSRLAVVDMSKAIRDTVPKAFKQYDAYVEQQASKNVSKDIVKEKPSSKNKDDMQLEL